jgi:hypothetical protein
LNPKPSALAGLPQSRPTKGLAQLAHGQLVGRFIVEAAGATIDS